MGQRVQASLFPAKQPSAQGLWKLPEGWEWVRLDQRLVEMQSGFACARKHSDPNGLPHLRPFNISVDGEVDLSQVIRIPFDLREDLSDFSLRAGDVLFNNTNSVELVGKTAIVREPLECAFSNHLTRLHVRAPDRLDPRWLALALRLLQSQGYFSQRCNRWIGQAGFNPTKLAEVPIPLPKLDIQRRIMARIEALLAELKEARALAAAIRCDTDRIMDAALAEVFDDLAVNSPDWQEEEVSKFCHKPQYGYTRSASKDPIGPKFLRITDIQDGKVDLDAVPYCQCVDEDLPKYRLEPGDILFARSGATTGKTFLVRDCPVAVFASYLIRLRIRERVLPGFLAWFFRSHAYWRQVKPRGAAQPNMNAEVLGKIKVRYPNSEDIQHQIVTHLDAIQAEVDEMCRLQAQDAELLEQLEQSILERAFRGKL